MKSRTFIMTLLASTALATGSFAQSAAPTPPVDQAAPAVAPPASTPAATTAVPAKPADFGTVYAKKPEAPKAAAAPSKPEPKAKPEPIDNQPAPKAKKAPAEAKASAPAKSSASATPAKIIGGLGNGSAGNGPTGNGLALSSDKAIGSSARLKSAPALAPSQQSLESFQPGSTVSDKVLRDIAQPSSDYNEAPKYTPSFYSTNPNGPLGDSKSGWRGFKDGQFNVTFDGVPFGDANDPSHHSAAYFPGVFLGTITVDRGPGAASQVGYATFGGTMSLESRDLKDKASTEIGGSISNYGTYTGNVTQQTGLIGGDTRAMIQYSYQKTDGALENGHVDTNNVLYKLDKKLNDDWKVTLFGTTGYENYNNSNPISFTQLTSAGRSYGQLNLDPKSQQFTGYNNSEKRTDMLYAALQGKKYGWQIDNKVYTYAYDYPELQNNGNDQSIDGASSIANGGTLGVGKSVIKVTNPVGTCFDAKGVSTGRTCASSLTFGGVADGDVTGFKKNNNYRAYGNTLDVKRDIDLGIASGQLRAGFWIERVNNHRYQQYYDYTQGKLYDQFPATITTTVDTGGTKGVVSLSPTQANIAKYAASYKLDLDSQITNTQTYAEYEWKPLAGLSITPGYKYESFTRDHDANVNQTTLQPAHFSKTYEVGLPFLSARQKLTPELTVYGQASKGFLAPPVAAYYVYNFAANDINPETTTNLQTGAVFKSNNWTLAADVYRILSKDASSVTTGADNVSYLISNQNVRRQGIEGQATYAYGNGLALFGSAALIEAEITNGPSNGLRYQNAPRYTAAGGPVYDDGRYFGSLLYKITGDQYGSGGQAFGNELNHVGSYNSTDAVAGMRFNPKEVGLNYGDKIEFKVGVANILDHHAVTDIGGTAKTNDPTTAGLSYTSQAGRIIFMGGKVTF